MGFLLDTVYPNLPVPLQHLAISVFGWQWKQRRFGGVFEQELKDFKDRENYTRQQWHDYQTAQLRKLLVHAFQTVPYYRETFSNLGFTLSDFEKFELEDLPKLPLLSKNTLREKGTNELLSSIREPKGEFFGTSGSTGTPCQILFSYPMHQRWSAGFEARIRNWAGVNRRDARGMIGGRRVVKESNMTPPFYRYNFAEKQVYFSAYHISKNTAYNYVEGIKKYGVQYMTGYAMSNYFLARFIEEAGLEVPTLRAVLPSSEKLSQEMRDTFMRVYGCKTFDEWSGVEACALVSECEYGSLHISEDLGIIEILDENGKPVAEGESGEVVCTGLVNYDQPLIRYRIGDMMTLGSGKCACGREMPIIKDIVGRIEDTVVGKDGREMVRFHGIFIGLPNVVESQVVQYDYDLFQINLVTTGRLTQAEKDTIKQRMESQLGEIKLEITEVPNIPRSKNGKFKAVISHVKRK